jgi:hypothetical protein
MLAKTRCLSIAIIVALLSVATTTTSCGSDDASFCDSAQSLQTAVSQLELEDVTAALGAEFWGAVQTTVDDMVRSTSGEFREVANILQQELDSLIDRLEAVDYDLVQIALSPSVAADLAILTASLIAFVANELQTEIDTSCSL